MGQSQSVLFNHDGNDHRTKINKAATGDTASILFQSGFSGRAEFGLPGEDNFVVKVSGDGAVWHDAIRIDNSDGDLEFPASGISSAADIWHAGNDGSGSGLDADLLDGLHASSFAELTGANFTGNVSVDGQVLQPNVPAFSAHSVVGGGTGVLVFMSVDANNGNHYNVSNGRFTAPVTGHYMFSASVFINMGNLATRYGYFQIRKNGTAVGPVFHSIYNTTRSYETISGNVILGLTQGDYVDVHLAGGGGATIWAGAYSGFSGQLIG